jgi:hypothetical protein
MAVFRLKTVYECVRVGWFDRRERCNGWGTSIVQDVGVRNFNDEDTAEVRVFLILSFINSHTEIHTNLSTLWRERPFQVQFTIITVQIPKIPNE